MYCNYILQLCSKLLFGHWPYSVYLYICTWPLAINFADMPINILSLSFEFDNSNRQITLRELYVCFLVHSPVCFLVHSPFYTYV